MYNGKFTASLLLGRFHEVLPLSHQAFASQDIANLLSVSQETYFL